MNIDKLTNREEQIFRMFGQGKTAAQIATELNISPRTAESHRDHIRGKLRFPNVQTFHQAAFRLASGYDELVDALEASLTYLRPSPDHKANCVFNECPQEIAYDKAKTILAKIKEADND